jgi:predicted MFS family arabinose efflux permease
MALVLVAMGLILFFFEDKLTARTALRIGPLEVFLLLGQVFRHPTVLRVSAVYFFFMFVWNTCYVFIDDYLTSRFQVGTLGASMAILVSGAALALSSAFLVSPLGQRYSKRTIVFGSALVMALASALFVGSPSLVLSYLAILPLAAAFAAGYATLLSVFSASVDSSQQGWVMGVSTALWTLGAGLTSVIGGDLMGDDIRLPFFVAIASAALAMFFIAILWRAPDLRQIASKERR